MPRSRPVTAVGHPPQARRTGTRWLRRRRENAILASAAEMRRSSREAKGRPHRLRFWMTYETAIGDPFSAVPQFDIECESVCRDLPYVAYGLFAGFLRDVITNGTAREDTLSQSFALL